MVLPFLAFGADSGGTGFGGMEFFWKIPRPRGAPRLLRF